MIGPHGSGKSTLLEHLIPRIGGVLYRTAGDGTITINATADGDPKLTIGVPNAEHTEKVVWHQLRKSCPGSMRIRWDLVQGQADRVLVLDGYEQLSIFARFRLLAAHQRHRFGILITSHRATWFPTICNLTMTPELATEIIQKILAQSEVNFAPPNSTIVATMLVRHRGNMRELLMDLYDQFEAEQSERP